ncbi:hypothetical protein L873DRAFT_1370703 [Choiromyces venosus 120613-1]|uniref:Secreted protein n=1 Tax=Choiromyces venosus 120613-1 TaxID=1336337 RepID=A0A3N4J9T0_9PEZI|nr:hypothetical protein L873DRAFT_1370703 [Choiromyces venosus 120613-1]
MHYRSMHPRGRGGLLFLNILVVTDLPFIVRTSHPQTNCITSTSPYFPMLHSIFKRGRHRRAAASPSNTETRDLRVTIEPTFSPFPRTPFFLFHQGKRHTITEIRNVRRKMSTGNWRTALVVR